MVSSNDNLVRVGIDIGGTFTDVALERNGQIHSAKILTDHAAPDRAILTVLRKVLDDLSIGFGDINVIIHGTTLATNALIERNGAHTALITTKGFRDVIEMRTESRFEQYDLNITLPSPLIDRCDRFTLTERISARGRVLVAPDPAEIQALVDIIGHRQYESVAIGFLHSYLNGSHECLVREALRRELPDVDVSISSEVSPQMREYERFNTVCANAYVKPAMKSYLDRLVVSLEQAGVCCSLFMMHSGGGIISVDTAAAFPVRLIESGPAGGAIFAADIARHYGLESAVSFDMGGTTAKICLIENHSPKTAKTFEVARTYRFKKGSGMPISIPVVEMVEIGAGGGSMASIDTLRQIRVGPRSAGSEPGPACYGHGGTHATVTDADLLLGILDPDYFAGGTMKLSCDKAAEAIMRDVGAILDLDPPTAAHGITEVVDENMSNAGRVHAVENGFDISDFTMITFGGAGPMHAGRICEKLGIQRLIVPPGAGVGSAIGFLRAPFAFEAAHAGYMPLSEFDAEVVNQLVDNLTKEATEFAREGMTCGEPIVERTAYMRYKGQGWEIPVVMPVRCFEASDAALFEALFEKAYIRFFGRPIANLEVELVSWSIKVSSSQVSTSKSTYVIGCDEAPVRGKRLVFDVKHQDFEPACIYDRHTLAPGMHITGPAVIVERETATLVPSNFEVFVQTDLCLLVQAATVVATNRTANWMEETI